jgi:hypothetical protein
MCKLLKIRNIYVGNWALSYGCAGTMTQTRIEDDAIDGTPPCWCPYNKSEEGYDEG